MPTHTFLVINDEGLGEGDYGNMGKSATAGFTNDPNSHTNNAVSFGIVSKGSDEVFASLVYRLGPSGEDPSRPIVKKGSEITSATLRVVPTISASGNFDCRLAVMSRGVGQNGRWKPENKTFAGEFYNIPMQVEVDPVSPRVVSLGTASTANNNWRHIGSTPGYGRRAIGINLFWLPADSPAVLNRVFFPYDTHPGTGDVYCEVWSIELGGDFVLEPGVLLATSEPHASLPGVEPGYHFSSRAFEFTGSDQITLDSDRYAFMVVSEVPSSTSPRMFVHASAGFPTFLDSMFVFGIDNGIGGLGFFGPKSNSNVRLTANGNDTLLANHVGTPVSFLNLANWTNGVDFDFTGLETMIQSGIDDADFASGDPILVCLDPFQGDSGDEEVRSFESINLGGSDGAELILTWLDPDETPPIVTIDSISDGDCLSGTVSIDCTATDPQGVDEVTAAGVDEVRALLVGASPELIGTDGTGTASDEYNISFDTTLYPDGVYTLRAEAEDLATPTTNTGTDEISITIDNTAPTGSITDPSDLDTVSGTIAVLVSASDATSGVASVELLVNGAPTGITDTTVPYMLGWDSTTVADGDHTLAARMVDVCGNSADTAAITVTVTNDVFPIVESQVRVSGVSTVTDRTQAANLRVKGLSSVKGKGGSQLVVKKET